VSTPLVEALRQLNLQPGQSYHVEVDGKDVELRIRGSDEPPDPADQVMLRPWVWLPTSEGQIPLRIRYGPIDPPDPVVIDDEDLAPDDLQRLTPASRSTKAI
jgi:hypothetical protein